MRPFVETRQPKGEFRVIAKGSDVAYNWLQMIKRVYDSPFAPSELSDEKILGLGGLDVHNSLVYLIVPGIIFSPPNGYSIRTSIVGKASEMEMLSGLMGIVDPDGSSGFGRKPRGFSFKDPDDFPGIYDVAQNLRRRLSRAGFEISEENEDGKKAIAIQKGNAEPYQLEQGTTNGRQIYQLRAKGALGDPKLFEQRYLEHGTLIQEIIKAIYEVKGEYPPNKTLELAPSEETASEIQKIEAMLKIEKQKLSIAGLDDGAEVEEEIKRKIREIKRPTDTFDDIGGADKAKAELETMAYSLVHPEAFTEEGTLPPRRVLLFGPSGTGKTLLVRALANKANCDFLSVEIADIVNALYGRSEKLIQKMFDVARERAPIILFIDEMDAIALHREHADNLMARIVNVLLTNLDGMKGRDDRVMVVGTTNRLSSIDTALLRPGRFDTLVEVPIPDNEGRKTIFQIHMKKAVQLAEGKELFVPTLNLDALVEKTAGFSGDDIREIITRTLRVRVERKRAGLPVSPTTTEDLLKKVADYESVRIAKQKEIGFRPEKTS